MRDEWGSAARGRSGWQVGDLPFWGVNDFHHGLLARISRNRLRRRCGARTRACRVATHGDARFRHRVARRRSVEKSLDTARVGARASSPRQAGGRNRHRRRTSRARGSRGAGRRRTPGSTSGSPSLSGRPRNILSDRRRDHRQLPARAAALLRESPGFLLALGRRGRNRLLPRILLCRAGRPDQRPAPQLAVVPGPAVF